MNRARLIFALGMLAMAGGLRASTFDFTTPNGAKAVGGVDPVDAEALFTVTSNTITITLQNLEANPTEDAQVLDALTFQLNGQTIPGGASIDLSMSETEFIKVNSNETYTKVTSNLPSWNLSDKVVGSTVDFSFCNAEVTGTNCTSEDSKTSGGLPEGGIIGQSGSGSKFTNANSTILNSHSNPYIYEQAVFTITLTSGTFNTSQNSYTNLLFGYGDTSGEYEAITGQAPEPSSFWMMAAALALGLLAFKYRRTIRVKS